MLPLSLFCFHIVRFWVNISSKRAFSQKATVKPAERGVRIPPLLFFMPLSKCYCNDRMRIQNFRLIYASVLHNFGGAVVKVSAKTEVPTATSCLVSLSSLPLSLGYGPENRSALCWNFSFHSALCIPAPLFTSEGVLYEKSACFVPES